MSKEKDTFLEDLAKKIEYSPTAEQFCVGAIAERYYENLRSGDIKRHGHKRWHFTCVVFCLSFLWSKLLS